MSFDNSTRSWRRRYVVLEKKDEFRRPRLLRRGEEISESVLHSNKSGKAKRQNSWKLNAVEIRRS